MKDKLEKIFNDNHEGYGVYNKNGIIEELLALFSVVWQSEQLCEGLHSTDFNGKCFKCGEQVFVREPK